MNPKVGGGRCWALNAYAQPMQYSGSRGCRYLTPYLAKLSEVFSLETHVVPFIGTEIRLVLMDFLVCEDEMRYFTTNRIPIH
jgi:hypothetical protein